MCRRPNIKSQTLLSLSKIRSNKVSPFTKYNRLSLSRIQRDSVEYFEISVPRHIRFAELRRKIRTTTLTNIYVIGLLKLEIY